MLSSRTLLVRKWVNVCKEEKKGSKAKEGSTVSKRSEGSTVLTLTSHNKAKAWAAVCSCCDSCLDISAAVLLSLH